jgi:hypothetical protein
MERRKAVTAAAAASLTLLAGAAGIALNSGIVGANADSDVGQLSPVASTTTTTNPPVKVYVDDPAATSVTAAPTSVAPAPTPAPTVQPTNSQPVTTSAASGYEDDDARDEHEDDDDRYEHEDDEDRDEHEEEYEGADDDD